MTKFFAQWPSGRSVVFRSLGWAEFQKYERLLLARPVGVHADVYLDIYRAVVLEGPSDQVVTAGMAEFIGNSAMAHNPFNGNYDDVSRVLDLKRGELQRDYLLAARAVIVSLFHVTVEEIATWDAEKFFEFVAMAEFVSGRKLEPGDASQKTKSGKPAPSPPSARPLSERQELVVRRTRDRDEGTPAAPPVRPPDPAAARLQRRPLTPAQQTVMGRVARSRAT